MNNKNFYGRLIALIAILILTKIIISDDYWAGVIVEAVFLGAGLLIVSKDRQ